MQDQLVWSEVRKDPIVRAVVVLAVMLVVGVTFRLLWLWQLPAEGKLMEGFLWLLWVVDGVLYLFAMYVACCLFVPVFEGESGRIGIVNPLIFAVVAILATPVVLGGLGLFFVGVLPRYSEGEKHRQHGGYG